MNNDLSKSIFNELMFNVVIIVAVSSDDKLDVTFSIKCSFADDTGVGNTLLDSVFEELKFGEESTF